jgi:hypothetical protein
VAFYVLDEEDPFFPFSGVVSRGFSINWHKCRSVVNIFEVCKGLLSIRPERARALLLR